MDNDTRIQLLDIAEKRKQLQSLPPTKQTLNKLHELDRQSLLLTNVFASDLLEILHERERIVTHLPHISDGDATAILAHMLTRLPHRI